MVEAFKSYNQIAIANVTLCAQLLPYIFMNYFGNVLASFSWFVNVFVTFRLCQTDFLLLFQLCKLSHFPALGDHLSGVKEGVFGTVRAKYLPLINY